MKRIIAAACLSLLVAPALLSGGLCRAAEADNPYKRAKVGDWVSYVTTTESDAMPGKQTTTVKQTVKARDEKEVTLLVEEVNLMVAKGSDPVENKGSRDVKISLDNPYYPHFDRSIGITDDGNVAVIKVADGKESMTVAGKTLACQWTENSMSMKEKSEFMSASGTYKSWFCPEVPLHGVAKSDISMVVKMGEDMAIKSRILMELKDFGGGM